MAMSRVLAWLSLAVGAAVVLVTLIRQGPALSLGVIFGTLLIANALVRLWVLRSGKARG